jgi:drug/metabolite transporter (DMT)-like permease
MSPPVVLAALAAVIIWGASPVAAKIAVQDLAPMTVAVLRTVIGGLAALPLALALRIPLPATGSDRMVLVLSGFCGFVAFPVLFTLGVNLTSANHASMILAGLPVFTGAIAMAWDRKRPQGLWWAGCAVALVGELILIWSRAGSGDAGASLSGDLIVFASNLFASLGYVAGGRLQRAGYPSSGTTFYGAAIFAIVLLPFVPFVVRGADLPSGPEPAWLAVAYLAVGVTIVGYMLWYWALGKGGIERMGLFQFLQPVSGVILAWALLAEHITPSFLAASGLVLFGVWLALRAK